MLALIILLSTSVLIFTSLSAWPAFGHRAQSYQITGTVFDDLNQDGAMQAREPGINGVTVTAYDKNNQVVATTTSATVSAKVGQYTLSIPDGTGPVRVQFSGFGPTVSDTTLKQYYPTMHNSQNEGTTISFINGATTLNQGLVVPSDYCQNLPKLATNCYVADDQMNGPNAGSPVLVSWPYDRSGNSPMPDELALAKEIGTTWGTTYRPSSDSLFVSAFQKRMTGYGPAGPGGIYLISGARSGPPSVSTFLSLSAGTDPHADYINDASSYDAVGKMSLGGMDLSEDESTLYVMNLYDKKLYSIPIGARPAAPTPGTPTSMAVPVPSGCAASDWRPFAVKVYRGKVYVGAVCSAESTQTVSSVQGYVLAYDPASGQFASNPVFQFGFAYPRGCADEQNATLCAAQPDKWNAWNSNFSTVKKILSNGRWLTVYPQPWLTSLDFDRGDLILGLRDRYGDQSGFYSRGPDSSDTNLYSGQGQGDLLRACLKTAGNLASGWALENNGSCGGIKTGGANTGIGPGGGSYYYKDKTNAHDHLSYGGVLQLAGQPNVDLTALDPTDTTWSGGTTRYNNTSAAKVNGYRLYASPAPPLPTFGKANGIGSLVALCESAPVEIGNRVWIDTNKNGIQDVDEPSVAGVTVSLYDEIGNKVGSTVTDANGNYYFSIDPYKTYTVKLDNPADYQAGGPLADYVLAQTKAGTDRSIDSNGVLPTPGSPIGPDNFPQAAVAAHQPGENDHTFDFGFFMSVPPTPTPTPEAPTATPTSETPTPTPVTTPTPTPEIPTPTPTPEIPTPTPTPVTTPTPTLEPVPPTPVPVEKPDLLIHKTHDGNKTFKVGEYITYHLIVQNNPHYGPVPKGNPIIVTDFIPAGMTNISASGTNWRISLSTTTSPSKVTAIYIGKFPVAAGTTLPEITVRGRLTIQALPLFKNSVTVYTPNDRNPGNNSTIDKVIVKPEKQGK